MDTVIAGAALAPVVDGHEVTDDHIHNELARWSPKKDWLILSPARSALFVSGHEKTDAALKRDGSLDDLIRNSTCVLAILVTSLHAGQVADAGSHYLCVLCHRVNQTLYIYDSLDFKRSPLSKTTVKKFSVRVSEACLLRVRGT